MNCFMGYNPLVAKEVKITTWIKEFDGDSPVYPSFPNDGDCFVVFATDEDALTHNALSKKTYTNGDWADAEGGGGGGDAVIPLITISGTQEEPVITCDVTYSEFVELVNNSPIEIEGYKAYPCAMVQVRDVLFGSSMIFDEEIWITFDSLNITFIYSSDGTITPQE